MDQPIQLSLPLPGAVDTRIYVYLTIKAKSILLFLTTASGDETSNPTPLGSFVYALPDRYNPAQPLSTPLCTVEPTIEFTTRLAKLVSKKTQLPTYVGNSISFASTALGGSVEEEMEAFQKVAALVLSKLQPVIQAAQPLSDGLVS
ncbi:hypothetical protein QBC34DRAFT_376573 [Podospora aff. communis PSN243]|uniref:Proteasome assembly chaperone 3 n=1 Tax=Podospora aff. communis PSN243 TaxID=3040156 RepID=A0AAV9GZ66_9PEZI|nr:hypothetical protein QBC34DRAFT_376573 [Podospora aff. communis PSN243]